MTPDWHSLFQVPSPITETWFQQIAAQLLNRTIFRVAGREHRLIEIEFYYHGPTHADPFAHCNPLQVNLGRWYFHKTGNSFRGGSFKGLDLTFGDGTSHGGILFRGLETGDGRVVDGPSLLVDHLLQLTGQDSVATLDSLIHADLAWKSGGLLELAPGTVASDRRIRTSARVGLSLKKRQPHQNDPAFEFLFRRYRYLSEPIRTAKGRVLLALARLLDGESPAELARELKCPVSTLQRYEQELSAGANEIDPTRYYGRDWTTVDLCRLHGLWSEYRS